MYDRVLIAVDGSEEAKCAATHGLEVAGGFDATVDVIHVVDQRSRRFVRTNAEGEDLEERSDAILAEIETLATERGQSTTATTATGVPQRAIADHAAETNADLIVVGRQGATGLGKRLLGGVTEGILHRSEIPVLVVPREDSGAEIGYSSVVVPTDGSENAAAATPHGVEIARRFGSAIHVLNVVALQSAGGPFNAGGLDEAFIERLEAEGEAAVEEIATGIAERAPATEVTTAVTRSSSFQGASAGIGEYVADNAIELIVMGSRGRSNLERQLLGSVTSSVLRTVDVPVLIVDRPS
ncbi:universal stress protein [Saliphagus sp. LR7]|uniref:universal stress protein n=1 Tax=Saliphagus sp. LR7 TaxID=2282654 RepID=UPI000DF73628|nr:universal stress protein [Saliphagus sp. LR7]